MRRSSEWKQGRVASSIMLPPTEVALSGNGWRLHARQLFMPRFCKGLTGSSKEILGSGKVWEEGFAN